MMTVCWFPSPPVGVETVDCPEVETVTPEPLLAVVMPLAVRTRTVDPAAELATIAVPGALVVSTVAEPLVTTTAVGLLIERVEPASASTTAPEGRLMLNAASEVTEAPAGISTARTPVSGMVKDSPLTRTTVPGAPAISAEVAVCAHAATGSRHTAKRREKKRDTFMCYSR